MNLCKEEASAVDLFDGKPLEKVANVLNDVILGLDEGMTVGVDGEWGSGKSTVIKLLKGMLGSKADIFVFDAWAHEGDALRRSFLEAIIRHYVQEIKSGRIKGNDAELTSLYLEVAQRKKITKISHTSKPTGLGISFLLTILASTIGCGLLSCCRPIGDSSPALIAAVAGGALVSTPFIVMLVNAVRIFSSKAAKGKRWKSLIDAENWSFIESSGTSDVEERVTDEAEKSSIEFENLFTTYISQIIQENPDKKFVIVIDNLDRINVDDALKIWSTLQTFLQNKNACCDCSEPIYKKLWLVVPYDGQSIAKLWDKNQEENSSVSKSFLDKCFQLRIDVPTPVMSTWISYAKEQAQIIFSTKGERFVDCVIKMLSYMHEAMSDSLTPREIKSYLNEVAVTRLVVDGSISDECVCYYVYCRYIASKRFTLQNIRREIIEGNMPSRNQLHFMPKDAKKQLAGMTYGVCAEQGEMLLLTDPILKSMQSGDVARFKSMREGFGGGFWNVFDYVVGNKISFDSGAVGGDLQSCLQASKVMIEDNIPVHHLSLLHKKISETIDGALSEEFNLFGGSISVSDIGSIELISYLVKFLNKMGDESRLKKLYHKVVKSYDERLASKDAKECCTEEYIKALGNLLEAFPSKARACLMLQNLVGERLEKFVESVDASDSFSKVFDNIRPSADVMKALEASIIDGRDVSQYLGDVSYYIARKNEKREWNSLILRLSGWLMHVVNVGHVNQFSHLKCVYDVFLNALYAQGVDESLRKLVKERHFYIIAGLSNDKDLIYRAAILVALVDPDLIWSVNDGSANAMRGVEKIRNLLAEINDDSVAEMVKVLQDFGLGSSVWTVGKCIKNKMFNPVATKLLEDSSACISDIKEVEGVALEYLDSFSNEESSLNGTIVLCNKLHDEGLEFTADNVDRILESCASRLLICLLDKNIKFRNVQSLVENKLKNLPKEKWLILLNSDPHVTKLVRKVVEENQDFNLGAGALEALQYILLEGTKEEQVAFSKQVASDEYAWLVRRLDCRLAYGLSEVISKKLQQIDWSDEAHNMFMAYSRDLVNYNNLDIQSIHERIKELLPTGLLEYRLPWLIELIKRCKESDVWNQDAEVAQIAELIINQAFKDGKIKELDAEFLLSAYGLELDKESVQQDEV